MFVGGDVPGKVNHIYFDDIDIKLLKRTDYPGGVYDKRPCVGEGFVNDKVYGFYIDTASDIYINNPRLKWGDTRPVAASGELLKQKASTNVVVAR